MMKFCILASGSQGNAIYLSDGQTHILVDMGLPLWDLAKRLKSVGVEWDEIDAVFVTHEHMDHVRGLKDLEHAERPKLYVSRLTYDAFDRRLPSWPSAHFFKPQEQFQVGSFDVLPFRVMHDSADPVGFVFSRNQLKIGIALDMGCATRAVVEALTGCHICVIESNHDVGLLANSKRPRMLKQRIRGSFGHLSNEECARLLEQIVHNELYYVFLGHISQECNEPRMALDSAHDVFLRKGQLHTRVYATYQDRVSRYLEFDDLSLKHEEFSNTETSRHELV